MRYLSRFFIVFILTGLLLGCGTAPVQPPQTYYVAVPSSLLLPCSPVAPPNREKYKAATVDEKEKMLFDTVNRQNGILSKCNIQIMATVDWSNQQKLIFQKKEGVP